MVVRARTWVCVRVCASVCVSADDASPGPLFDLVFEREIFCHQPLSLSKTLPTPFLLLLLLLCPTARGLESKKNEVWSDEIIDWKSPLLIFCSMLKFESVGG